MTRTWFTRRNARLHLEHLEDRSVPSTFTVNTTLDEAIPGDGKLSLREAITKANGNPGADVIVVPAGVFKTTFGGEFVVTDSVALRGAGAGLTIIDGQQLDRVFDVSGTAPSSIRVVLQGLTVRNGNTTGHGGGILVGNADLIVRDSAVTGNRASLTGGGISNGAAPGTGNVTLVRTTVGRNVAGTDGGGVRLDSGTLTISGSTVRRNIAAQFGGGISATTPTLTNSTVSGNFAGDSGGGIIAGTATLTSSTISSNSAIGSGGGIWATHATLTNTTVSSNNAEINGGGIVGFITATLTNSTVSGNNAAINGGAIWATGATLLNCTIAENIAHTGGGLFHNPGSTFNVRNTIVALNLVDFIGTGPDVSGDFTSDGHNLIGIGSGGTGLTDGVNGDRVGTSVNPIDPKLGPLQNNGGKTKTMALLAGSPAIDKGDNAGVPPTDQRGFGFARKKDGNGDGLAIVDIGAFER